MIRLDGVSKSYNASQVIDKVSLTVGASQTIVLIGPSGCGKSTLLRMIVGLVQPDSGEVCIGDQQLAAHNTLAIRQRLGYVIQEGGLFPHLTGAGNLGVAARYQGWTEQRIEARIAELAELTRFPTDGLQRYPAQLSGGQRQRLGLMRALMLDPDVLLLDEPLGALDPMIRHALQEELKLIFASLGKCVVMVTHDLREAAYFADEIVLLRAGRIEQQGRGGDFLTNPANEFVTQFVRAQRSLDFGEEV